jgi:hypothetical protein
MDPKIDWDMLDLALNACIGPNVMLDDDSRSKLDDKVFCGPDRTVPVPNQVYFDKLNELVGNSKLSDENKQYILTLARESKRNSSRFEAGKSEG